MESKQAISSLSALAHEGRLAAFRLLVKAGPDGLPAGDIAHRLKVPPSSLSTSLTLLSNAGLVTAQRDGRSIIYRANYEGMSGLIRFLIADCCNGAQEVCSPLAGVITACKPGRRS
jgi:ArsR family transcriptional regulator